MARFRNEAGKMRTKEQFEKRVQALIIQNNKRTLAEMIVQMEEQTQEQDWWNQ